jgi:phosphatidylethanolamine-binding protein (PEBP) family uncharacterized protein
MKNLLYLFIATSLLLSCSDDAAEDVVIETEIEQNQEFTLSSAAIVNGELLDEFKCESKLNGIENSIPLTWSNIPEGTGSLAVIMHHYPNTADTESSPNTYLLLWGIDPLVNEIPYGTAGDGDWFMGANKDGNAISYTSPCSPSTGSHEYTITLYALSEIPETLPISSSLDVDYDVLINAIENVTVVEATILVFNDVTL